jgi:branched-chain amino acid transport system permease protein
MIAAILAGCALGGVYALASSGLVITYVSSGILNFAFAALAYFVARFYYYLHVQHGWGLAVSAIVSIVVTGPALGVLLWAVLFRFLRLASPVIKIVVTVGLSVCIGPIAILLFGNQPIVSPPGLAPQPVHVFHVLGTDVTLDQVIVYACAIVILAGGAAILRWTDAGLLVRAVVDSEAMASLSGVRPAAVAIGVWSVSTFMAGLAGVLAAPIIGLDINSFTVLIAAAFAAVIAARLRSLGTAVVVGLLMGIATSLVQRYLPSTSQFTTDVIPSIPFVFIVIFLGYSLIRRRVVREAQSLGGPLDRAIAPQGGSEAALARAASVSTAGRRLTSSALPVALIVVVALLPLVLHGLWTGMVALGLGYAVCFLSYTIATGEAGIVWLCQITFAGIGAVVTAELATNHGWSVLAGVLAGGLVCAVLGAVIGFATLRLGDLYVALVTLAFGLLVDNLVFQINSISNFGAGIAVPPPAFATTDTTLSWLELAIFCLLALVVATLRRSTFGFAVSAVRWSEPAARMTGLSVVATKVWVSALAATAAGIGGGLIAIYTAAAVPQSFATFSGLIWMAVLVTIGVRSTSAALIAGLSFAFIPEVFATYLPTSWGEVPPALFGLGAVLVARNPEGTLAMHARQLEQLLSRRQRARSLVDVITEQTAELGGGDAQAGLAPATPVVLGKGEVL